MVVYTFFYLEDSIVAVEGEQATLTASFAVRLHRFGLVGNVNKSSLELAHSAMYLVWFYIDLAK